MHRNVVIALIVAMSAVAAGCATTPTTGALATPWGVARVHSFKPQQQPAEPNAAKLDKQVAQLLDETSQALEDANIRVASLSSK
jgi:hypothetical protein